jgi:hypothetical protein
MVAKSSTFGDEGMTDDAVRTRLVIRAERVRQRHATGEARVARSASHRWQQLVGNKRAWSYSMVDERLGQENVCTCARRLKEWVAWVLLRKL